MRVSSRNWWPSCGNGCVVSVLLGGCAADRGKAWSVNATSLEPLIPTIKFLDNFRCFHIWTCFDCCAVPIPSIPHQKCLQSPTIVLLFCACTDSAISYIYSCVPLQFLDQVSFGVMGRGGWASIRPLLIFLINISLCYSLALGVVAVQFPYICGRCNSEFRCFV